MSATASTYEPHPLAALIPSMSDDEYARLRDDVAANGLLDPIALYEGKVLDGRHRYRACTETGVGPVFFEYDGASPAQFVISRNLHRRQLSTSQRAMVATDFLPHLEAEAHGRKRVHGQTAPGRSAQQHSAEVSAECSNGRASHNAGEMVGVSASQVERAKKIRRTAPELADRIRSGDLTVNAAYLEVSSATAKTEAKRKTNTPRGLPLPVESRAELSSRNEAVAKKTRERIHGALATLDGLTAGLSGLHLVNLRLVTDPDEASHWHTQLAHAVDALRRFDRALKEAQL